MARPASRLGAATIMFFALSAAAPLSGIPAVPLGVPVVGLLLLVFAVGFVAMSRQLPSAGGLYVFIARGLGRPIGIGAAWIALVSYNAVQIALYGAVGAAVRPLLAQWFGIRALWWVVALCCWALVGALGVLRARFSGRILALLVLAEVGVIGWFGVVALLQPGGRSMSWRAFDPQTLIAGGGHALGATLAVVTLGFIGFETGVVHVEQARVPGRSVARGTYAAVVVIALVHTFALYAGVPERLVPWAAELRQTIVVTSLLAAMISLHHVAARYMFALGRDRVLPAPLGRLSARTAAPRTASLIQSLLAAVLIGAYAWAGLDPQVRMATWLGVAGGVGILVLLLTTSVATMSYFARRPMGENAWRRWIAPALATLGLSGLTYLVLENLPGLLGVSRGHVLIWLIPAALGTAALLGILYGLALKVARLRVYRVIGRGTEDDRTTAHIERVGAHRLDRAGR